MKKLLTSFVALAICFFVLNSKTSASDCNQSNVCRFQLQPKKAQSNIQIQTWQMKNGAKLYFVNRPQLPIVDIQVLFAAGSVYDGKNWGLAALTNSMMGEKTSTLTDDQIAAAFDAVGAQFSTSSNRDFAAISLRSLANKNYLNRSIAVLTDVVNHPLFPQPIFQRVQNQTFAAIKLSEQQSESVAEKAFFQAVYKNEPYAHSSLGNLQTVSAIDNKQVKNFYQQYYVGNNAKIVVVGDITFLRAKEIAQEVVGQLPSGKQAPKLSQSFYPSQNLTKHIDHPGEQTAIVIGQLAITRHDPNYFPLIVGNAILGGLPLTSIFFEKVREQQGLAYFAYSAFLPLQYRGVFQVELKTRLAKTQEALNIVRKILQNFVANGPSEKQLEAAKKSLIGSFPLSLSTNKNILILVSNIAFYNRPLNYLETYRDNVNKVTALQIKKAFQKVINPKQMITITVGPKAS